MNQGRIWCVVNPSVGLPLLLGSVALTSLAVHTAVMTHTTWMGNYWMGSARTRVSENATPPDAATASKAMAAFSVTVAPVPAADAKSPASFVITVTPNAVATAGAEPAGGELAGPGSGPVLIRAASAN